jgi:hypothetical protein
MFKLSRKALRLSTVAMTVAAVGGGAIASTASAATLPNVSTNNELQMVMSPAQTLKIEQQLKNLQLTGVSVPNVPTPPAGA